MPPAAARTRSSEINAEISARSLAGPWRADGTLRIDGMRNGASVSTGKVDETGAMRLRIRADPASLSGVDRSGWRCRLDNGRGALCRHFQAGRRRPGTSGTAQQRRRHVQGCDGEAGAGSSAPQQDWTASSRFDHRAARRRRIPLRDRAARRPLHGGRQGVRRSRRRTRAFRSRRAARRCVSTKPSAANRRPG